MRCRSKLWYILLLGGEEKTMASMERQAVAGPRTPLLIQSAGRAAVKHSFPLNYVLQPWDLGREFYQAFRFGIVQFVRVYVTLRLSFKL
jgi:hypothetical protein